jgi:hypothetical protein
MGVQVPLSAPIDVGWWNGRHAVLRWRCDERAGSTPAPTTIYDRGMAIDPDKLPDGPEKIYVGHVELWSRYGRRHEIETMARALELMPDEVKVLIGAIFCDSQACAAYSIAMVAGYELADVIATAFDAAFCRVGGGHNCIAVEADEIFSGRDHLAWVEPHWLGDDEEAAKLGDRPPPPEDDAAGLF